MADRRSGPCAPHPFAEEKAMPMISRALILCAAMIALAGPVYGQGAAAPYKVYDTRPVITEGISHPENLRRCQFPFLYYFLGPKTLGLR